MSCIQTVPCATGTQPSILVREQPFLGLQIVGVAGKETPPGIYKE